MATPYQLRQECYHPSYAPNDFAWQYSPSFQRKRRRSGPRSTHYPRLLASDENKTSNHLPKKKMKVTPMKYMKRSPMKYMKARVSPIKFMKGSPKTKAMRNCRQEKRMYPLRVVLPGERKTQTPTSTRSTRATDKEESSRSRSARRRQLTAQSSDESKKKDVMTPRHRKRERIGPKSPKQELHEQSASREKRDASTSSTSMGTLHAVCRHCHHFDVDAFLASRIEPLLCRKVEAPEVRVKLRRSLEQRKNPHSLECVSHLFFKGMPLSEIAEAMELDSEELLRLVNDPEAPT